MEQLVIDVKSAKDAALIRELMKRFKNVEVNSFSTSLNAAQIRQRIEEGIKDANEGNVKPWKEVKAKLLKRIHAKAK